MKLINYLSNKVHVFTVLLAALTLSSCGSYQYVGQTSDGIYETGTENRQYESEAIPAESNNDYYANYFREKADEAEAYSQTDEIFTDIDTYQGNYDDTVEVTEQNAGWGETSSNVIINIHDTGFYNDYGWGWNRPWGWNGWYNWGWNSPYSWNYGWGWNNSFYNPYWRSPYYGFNNFGYGYGYGYGYSYTNGYHRRGISYNSGRRGSIVNRNSVLSSRYSRNTGVSPRTNITTRPRSSTTRPRTNSTTKPRLNTTRPRTNTSTPRPRTNTSTPRPRTNTSTPRSNNSTPRSISTPRSSSPSRSRSTSGGSSRRGRG